MAADPLLGEISIFAGNFAPRGWALCDGQLLPISQNTALFSILGTTYGGDGRTTFALPDLRGRAPIHPGTGPGLSTRRLGQRSGTEYNLLTTQQIPSHSHNATGTIMASSDEGTTSNPTNNFPASPIYQIDRATKSPINAYSTQANVKMSTKSVQVTIDNTGSNQAINNMQPFECINYIIALQGIFPSRS